MELTDKEFVELLEGLMDEPDEDELLDESYQEFKDSGHDEEADERLWNDEEEEW